MRRGSNLSDFLLKPELLRAISDLGFEHPSEGELIARNKDPADRDTSLSITSRLDISFRLMTYHSPTRVYSPGYPWYRCSVSSQIWYG